MRSFTVIISWQDYAKGSVLIPFSAKRCQDLNTCILSSLSSSGERHHVPPLSFPWFFSLFASLLFPQHPPRLLSPYANGEGGEAGGEDGGWGGADEQMFTALPLKALIAYQVFLLDEQMGPAGTKHQIRGLCMWRGRNRCFYFYLVVGRLARSNCPTDAALDSYKYLYLFILIIPQNHYFLCIFSFFFPYWCIWFGATKLHINSSRISFFFYMNKY